MASINPRNRNSYSEGQTRNLPDRLKAQMVVQIAPPKDETCDDVIEEIMSLIDLYTPKEEVTIGSLEHGEHGERPTTAFSLSSLSSAGSAGSAISSDLSLVTTDGSYHESALFSNRASRNPLIVRRNTITPINKRYSAPPLNSVAVDNHLARPTTPGTKILEWRRSVSNRCSQIISAHHHHHDGEREHEEWHPTSRWSMSTVARPTFFSSRESFRSRASSFFKESKEKFRQSPIKKLFKRSASMSSNLT